MFKSLLYLIESGGVSPIAHCCSYVCRLHQGVEVKVWYNDQANIIILNSGRGKDPVLQVVARNLWLESARLDCNVHFTHIKGANNRVADLLSGWQDHPNPTACLFQLLNGCLDIGER
jgi:hypothetical protein